MHKKTLSNKEEKLKERQVIKPIKIKKSETQEKLRSLGLWTHQELCIE
jgi:hypothetical protein